MEHYTNIISALMLVSIVLFDATGDALRTLKRQVLHHVMEDVQIVLWFMVILFLHQGFDPWLILVYVLARFSLFDAMYNVISGNKLLYVGDSSLYDKFWRWFGGVTKNPPEYLVLFPKVICFVSLLVLLIFSI